MMPAGAKLICRFIASTRGVAAIEFAMILPVLAVLFLGTFDGGRALATYMKLRSATYALASITNQYTTIQSSDMTGIIAATTAVLAPYSSTPAAVKVSQITISAGGTATISWGAAQNASARARGSGITIPATLATPSTYLIFAELSYTFTPMFGYFSAGSITFTDNLYTTPRSSACIPYVPVSGAGC